MEQQSTFSKFKMFLKERLTGELPGRTAHQKMIPEIRLHEFEPIPEKAKKSSVLLLLFEKNNKICTVLIQRPEYNGVHSAQVSLPGGRFEENDVTLENTALREAEEEIGLNRTTANIVCRLLLEKTKSSNFRVTPFIAFTDNLGVLVADEHEVKKIYTVEIDELLGSKNIKTKNIRIQSGKEYETLYFDIMGLTVWGATAMILSEFKELYEQFVQYTAHIPG